MSVTYDSLERLLDLARQKGAQYADVRYSDQVMEGVSLRNGEIETTSANQTVGMGVRVLCDGAWGFSGTARLDPESLDRAVSTAVAIATAGARWPKPDGVVLAPEPPHVARWATKATIDPFDVPLEDRAELLRRACAGMRETGPVSIAQAGLVAWRETKHFASTEGSRITQRIVETGANLSATARGGGDTQKRSFADYATAGHEFIEDLDLAGRGAMLGQEAADLLKAESCPRGPQDLVLGGEMVALQIHESCGHPIELDRVLGSEATFAGTSFLTPDRRGAFRYGSDSVSITADATIPGGLGSFGFDDEGVAAQRNTIVDRGQFVDYLTSRETAGETGGRSGGTMRAQGALNLPLIRMTNINLEPGDWTLDEIIRDTKQGVFLNTPKSWSLDDKRLNFHFGCEIGYEIVDGALGRMLKNGAYTAMTPEFWGACDAVAGRAEWHVWGTPGCAKGEPVQIAHVGHGASPARYRSIKVGVGA